MSVSLRSGESQEALLKRWRKEVTKAGVLKALRKKRWFVSRSEKRRIAKAKAMSLVYFLDPFQKRFVRKSAQAPFV